MDTEDRGQTAVAAATPRGGDAAAGATPSYRLEARRLGFAQVAEERLSTATLGPAGRGRTIASLAQRWRRAEGAARPSWQQSPLLILRRVHQRDRRWAENRPRDRVLTAPGLEEERGSGGGEGEPAPAAPVDREGKRPEEIPVPRSPKPSPTQALGEYPPQPAPNWSAMERHERSHAGPPPDDVWWSAAGRAQHAEEAGGESDAAVVDHQEGDDEEEESEEEEAASRDKDEEVMAGPPSEGEGLREGNVDGYENLMSKPPRAPSGDEDMQGESSQSRRRNGEHFSRDSHPEREELGERYRGTVAFFAGGPRRSAEAAGPGALHSQ